MAASTTSTIKSNRPCCHECGSTSARTIVVEGWLICAHRVQCQLRAANRQFGK